MGNETSAEHKVNLYDSMAVAWERYGEPLTMQFVPAALDTAQVRPGERLIDVGAGQGALAVAAAQRGLSVLAIDLAPEMVARAQVTLAEFAGSEAAVMNAEALDLDDVSFDVAISMFGATCCGDWLRGLSEMVRVTREGGRIVIGHWEHPHGPRAMQVLIETMLRIMPDHVGSWRPPQHDETSLRRDLGGSGCEDITIVRARSTSTWPHIDRIVEEIDPLYRYSPDYAALDDATRHRLSGPLRDAFAAYADPADGIVRIEDTALVAVARRPARQHTL